jgi:hypothetical protein
MFTRYHQTRASLQAHIASIYSMGNELSTPNHEDLDHRTVDLFRNLSGMASMVNDDAAPVNRSGDLFTMSDIEILVDEAPAATDSDSDNALQDALEENAPESEDGVDESWIAIPYVSDNANE